MHASAAAPPHDHEAPLSDCPNCGASLRLAGVAPRFCPACGQETTLHPPSVTEFAHEFVGHYVALEGPLWRSLRLLALHPGRLTTEYLRGRRKLYVLPLRLYLSASFIFFLLLKLIVVPAAPTHVAAETHAGAAAGAASAASAGRNGDTGEDDDDVIVVAPGVRPHVASGVSAADVQHAARVRAAECAKAAKAPEAGAASAPPHDGCGWLERSATAAGTRWMEYPARAQSEFLAHMLGVAPYAVFLMLPVYAGIVALVYRRRRMLFGEHLVFGMHLHAFWFLAGAVALLLPEAMAWLVPIAIGVHALFALRSVYAGSWFGTLVRAAVVAIAYDIALGLVTALVAGWLFLH